MQIFVRHLGVTVVVMIFLERMPVCRITLKQVRHGDLTKT
jgi:hypothetical protein